MFKQIFTTFALVFSCAVAAGQRDDIVTASQKRCYTTFAEQRSSGLINAGATVAVREWTAGCTGLFTASVTKGRVILQKRSAGAWVIVQRGISTTLPQLPPGTYRLAVENITGIRLDYTVRYRISGG